MGVSVADYLWESLEALGVRSIFGLPGITTLAALDSLRRRGSPRFVLTRHEQAAGHMADASARLFAPFGVALVDLGPGLANTVTSVLAASRDSSPLLIVAGNEKREMLGREVWHEMPEIDVFRPITRFAARLEGAEDLPVLLCRAISAALCARPGPVLISIPKDLWDSVLPGNARRPLLPPRISPDAKAVKASARLIEASKKPLIVVGSGARRARIDDALVRFVERTGIPVVTSPNGRGVLSEAHPLCIGHAGRFGNPQASSALKQADALLILGSRLSDLTTNDWSLLSETQRIVQVDQSGQMIGQNWPVEVAVVSDAGTFLDALDHEVDRSFKTGWNVSDAKLQRDKERTAFFAVRDPVRVKPQEVMAALERGARPEHTLVMGGGRFQQFVGEYLVQSSKGFFYAANSGTVGFALSAAIGAAIDHPERQVLCCLGDGDFMMNVQELETARREGAAVKIVVLNDCAFGAMKARQKISFGTEYTNPDLSEVSRAFGIPGRQVSEGIKIQEAVEWLLLESGPALLDVIIDREEDRSLMYGHDIGRKAVCDAT